MKRLWITLAIVVVVVVGGYFLIKQWSGDGEVTYQTSEVTRGDIENTVSATGTLSPLTEVEVGTQVSGTIDTVFVDYNDHVKAGQVLAVLDTTTLQMTVLDAEATLERAEAALEQAQSDLDRNKALFGRKMISEAELLPYQVAWKSQKATVKSAQAALTRAQINLGYAVIKSPIDGIVIERSVEAGQTVAASLSTPTLFVIAEDLSRMEILAQVDESDIGSIKEGQEVRFEVATYDDHEFSGTLKQIRLQPETVSNVVTYTAVVEAINDSGLLLPGMTASLDFVTSQRSNVLLIPNKALRFSPSQEVMQEIFEKRRAERAGGAGGFPGRPEGMPAGSGQGGVMAAPLGDSTGGPMGAPPAQGMMPGAGSSDSERGMVWCLDSTGRLTPAPVRLGLSDGINTEVVASPVLTEGSQVITGTGSSTATTTETSDRRRMGFGPPPGF